MPVDARIPLAGNIPRVPVVDFGGMRARGDLRDLQRKQLEQQQSQFEQNAPLRKAQNELALFESQDAREQLRIKSSVIGSERLKPLLDRGDLVGAQAQLQQRIEELDRSGIPSDDTAGLLQMLQADPDAARAAVEFNTGLGQRLGILKTPKSDTLSEEALEQKIAIARAQGDVTRGNQIAAAQAGQNIRDASPGAALDRAVQEARIAETQAKTAAKGEKAAANAAKKEADDKAAQEMQAQAFTLVNDLLTEAGRESVASAAGPIGSRLPTVRGSTADAKVKIQQLTSILTKDNLSLLTGVISDKDIEFLSRIAAGGLDLSGSDEGVLAELERLQQTLSRNTGLAIPVESGGVAQAAPAAATPRALGEQPAAGPVTIQEGDVATNQQTGERIRLVNGIWEPF